MTVAEALDLDRDEAVLVLEDGRTFRGDAYGARGTTVGEAVFSTGMTGYQETLTDPSYHRQVVVMTAQAFRQTAREMPEVADKIRAAIEERCRSLEPAG